MRGDDGGSVRATAPSPGWSPLAGHGWWRMARSAGGRRTGEGGRRTGEGGRQAIRQGPLPLEGVRDERGRSVVSGDRRPPAFPDGPGQARPSGRVAIGDDDWQLATTIGDDNRQSVRTGPVIGEVGAGNQR